MNKLEKIEQVPCPPTAQLYRIILSVPSVRTFGFEKATEDGIRSQKSNNTVVMLCATATLFNPISGSFAGRTSAPNGIKMVARSPDKSSFGLKDDGHFEIYFFAESTANFNIVFDLYMEREASDRREKLL